MTGKPLLLSRIKIRKQTILLCAAMLMFNFVHAVDYQSDKLNQQIISINPGYTFSGNGDGWGKSLEFNHLKSITPWLFHLESLNGWIINGNSWMNGAYDNQTGMSMSVNLGVAPFKMRDRIFYLAGGGTLAYMANITPRSGSLYQISSNGVTRYLSEVQYAASGSFVPGFGLSVGFITKVNSKIHLNLRGQIQSFSSGDMISTVSVGIGLNALNLK